MMSEMLLKNCLNQSLTNNSFVVLWYIKFWILGSGVYKNGDACDIIEMGDSVKQKIGTKIVDIPMSAVSGAIL